MVIVPFAFNVNPVGTVTPVKVISAGTRVVPSAKSLFKTDNVDPPV